MRRIAILLIVFLLSLSLYGQREAVSLYERLQALPGVEVKKIPPLDGYEESYLLFVEQPLDHDNPQSKVFKQRVWLSHRSLENPTVIITDGYNVDYNRKNELAFLLNANQVLVEHRFFGVSVPDSIDWDKLNLYQECADLHHIRDLLGHIYSRAWISTGISKGGQTTIAYRFYYPEDAKAWVPYVAPFTFAQEDPRVIEFIKHRPGTPQCRKKILDFQKALLLHKDVFLPLFIDFAQKKNMTFDKLGGYASGFEHGILEFSFSFWQWGFSCDDIPQDVMHIDSTMHILEAVNPFDFFSDQSAESLKPYYYQALTEMGIYTYDTSPFIDLLDYAKDPNFYFTVKDIADVKYNPCTNMVMWQWLKNNGNNMIYIYGDYDPWYSCGVEVDNSKVNSLKMVLHGGCHSTRIRDFDNQRQRQILDSLNKWIGI